MLRGRDFNLQIDDKHVAIVNETMAANLFPGQDPIGRAIRQDKETYTIVGVARNSKSRTIGEKPVNAAYLFLNAAPEKATSFFGTTIIVKTTVNPRGLARSVREQIAVLDPNMAVFNDETMQEHVDKSLLLPRISALLLGNLWSGRPHVGGHRPLRRHELFRSQPYARNRHSHGTRRKTTDGFADGPSSGTCVDRHRTRNWTSYRLARRTVYRQSCSTGPAERICSRSALFLWFCSRLRLSRFWFRLLARHVLNRRRLFGTNKFRQDEDPSRLHRRQRLASYAICLFAGQADVPTCKLCASSMGFSPKQSVNPGRGERGGCTCNLGMARLR